VQKLATMNNFLLLTFLIYFITHIPITICLDLQALLGAYYPEILRSFYAWYVQSFNDVLMTNPPVWLKSFIFAELVFQLPFFFVAIYGLYFKKNWIRIPSIIYGIHVSTTVWPILSSIVFSELNTDSEKIILFSCYAPYLLIPLLLAIYMTFNEVPFKSKTKKG
jgi:hypothetical protein